MLNINKDKFRARCPSRALSRPPHRAALLADTVTPPGLFVHIEHENGDSVQPTASPKKAIPAQSRRLLRPNYLDYSIVNS